MNITISGINPYFETLETNDDRLEENIVQAVQKVVD
jgi:hypothetical protein